MSAWVQDLPGLASLVGGRGRPLNVGKRVLDGSLFIAAPFLHGEPSSISSVSRCKNSGHPELRRCSQERVYSAKLHNN